MRMLFLAALVFALVEMTVTFVLARRWRNYGIVDVVWSGGFALIALLGLTLSWGSPDAAHGARLRGVLLAGMVVIWSLRLAVHLGIRVASHHPGEDVRYAQLRREWGDSTSRRMFGFYQLQGVLQAALAAPFLIVFASSGTPGMRLAAQSTWVLPCLMVQEPSAWSWVPTSRLRGRRAWGRRPRRGILPASSMIRLL